MSFSHCACTVKTLIYYDNYDMKQITVQVYGMPRIETCTNLLYYMCKFPHITKTLLMDRHECRHDQC